MPQPDDQLTEAELLAPRPGADRLIQHRWVADAQRRKSLWWAVSIFEETGGFSSPTQIRALETAASTLREILGNMGIEPWEVT